MATIAKSQGAPAMNWTLSIFKFIGADRTIVLKTVALPNLSEADAREVLKSMRAGLPVDCAASMVDGQGRNIRDRGPK